MCYDVHVCSAVGRSGVPDCGGADREPGAMTRQLQRDKPYQVLKMKGSVPYWTLLHSPAPSFDSIKAEK